MGGGNRTSEHECPVCFREYSPSSAVPKLLPCGHDLCLGCINELLLQVDAGSAVKCPSCKAVRTFCEGTLIEDSLATVYALYSSNVGRATGGSSVQEPIAPHPSGGDLDPLSFEVISSDSDLEWTAPSFASLSSPESSAAGVSGGFSVHGSFPSGSSTDSRTIAQESQTIVDHSPSSYTMLSGSSDRTTLQGETMSEYGFTPLGLDLGKSDTLESISSDLGSANISENSHSSGHMHVFENPSDLGLTNGSENFRINPHEMSGALHGYSLASEVRGQVRSMSPHYQDTLSNEDTITLGELMVEDHSGHVTQMGSLDEIIGTEFVSSRSRTPNTTTAAPFYPSSPVRPLRGPTSLSPLPVRHDRSSPVGKPRHSACDIDMPSQHALLVEGKRKSTLGSLSPGDRPVTLGDRPVTPGDRPVTPGDRSAALGDGSAILGDRHVTPVSQCVNPDCCASLCFDANAHQSEKIRGLGLPNSMGEFPPDYEDVICESGDVGERVNRQYEYEYESEPRLEKPMVKLSLSSGGDNDDSHSDSDGKEGDGAEEKMDKKKLGDGVGELYPFDVKVTAKISVRQTNRHIDELRLRVGSLAREKKSTCCCTIAVLNLTDFPLTESNLFLRDGKPIISPTSVPLLRGGTDLIHVEKKLFSTWGPAGLLIYNVGEYGHHKLGIAFDVPLERVLSKRRNMLMCQVYSVCIDGNVKQYDEMMKHPSVYHPEKENPNYDRKMISSEQPPYLVTYDMSPEPRTPVICVIIEKVDFDRDDD